MPAMPAREAQSLGGILIIINITLNPKPTIAQTCVIEASGLRAEGSDIVGSVVVVLPGRSLETFKPKPRSKLSHSRKTHESLCHGFFRSSLSGYLAGLGQGLKPKTRACVCCLRTLMWGGLQAEGYLC